MSETESVTERDLRAIEQRASAATPPPWQAWVEGRDGYGGDNVILLGPRDAANKLPDMYVSHVDADGSRPAPAEDLDFIANAREDMPRLVAEVRRLREFSDR